MDRDSLLLSYLTEHLVVGKLPLLKLHVLHLCLALKVGSDLGGVIWFFQHPLLSVPRLRCYLWHLSE